MSECKDSGAGINFWLLLVLIGFVIIAVGKRLDGQDRRLTRIERHLGIEKAEEQK